MSFGFTSVEHFLAYIAQTIVHDAQAVGGFISHVQVTEPLVEGVTALASTVYPPAASAMLVERAAYASLGLVLKAVQDGGDAAKANGTNMQLDAQFVQDVHALLPAVQAKMVGMSSIVAPSPNIPAPTSLAPQQ